ncbi:hypothetical protein GQ457_02G020430 [Hibiscus cannabinus]
MPQFSNLSPQAWVYKRVFNGQNDTILEETYELIFFDKTKCRRLQLSLTMRGTNLVRMRYLKGDGGRWLRTGGGKGVSSMNSDRG